MTTYHVDTNGSNSGPGSANSPWRTISHAMSAKLKPGDEVVVRAGTYNERVFFGKDGADGNHITLRSEVPGGAKIVAPENKPAIIIAADHVRVEGFDVSGGTSGITGTGVHHVILSNNIVHDNIGNGIFLARGDFFTIEGNVVHDNAARGPSSGIHLKAAFDITGSDSDDHRIVVRGNVAFDNVTQYGGKTDGNGISIDDFRNTKLANLPAYAYKTLVEGNIVYGNYGDGIQLAWSDHVTVRDNVAMGNNAHHDKTGPWSSEFNNMASSNNTFVGNIAIGDADNPAFGNVSFGSLKNTNVTWYDNVTWNGTAGDASAESNKGNAIPTAADGNLLGKDPGIGLADLEALTEDLLAEGRFELPNVKVPGLTILGDDGKDRITGSSKRDALSGGAGNDTIIGHAGDDDLSGDGGRDRLVGGRGFDTLAGGSGKDVFVFNKVAEAAGGDLILDFSEGDLLDLRGIDANKKASGDQKFAYIGEMAFSGKAGELRYVDGTLFGSVDGDRKADFFVEIANHHVLDAKDFIL